MVFISNYLPPFQKTTNITLASIMAALVCVATIFFSIPIPATGGYFNVGEAIIYIAAILFGPFIGGFAGGIGASIADVAVGYAIYAPGTLYIKFLEGFVIGVIVYTIHLKEWQRWKALFGIIVAVIVGGLIMVIGYWSYEAYILGLGPIVPVAEIPANMIQLLIGGFVAIPTSIGIQKAYPIWEFPSKEIN
ncbi:MAG: ECF transporter S component [Candidatus Helarchaeota archaeon]